MAVTGTYSPKTEDIIHSVSVDLVDRQMISEPIHVVQYDKQLPILEVSLWKSGQPYTVPTNCELNVRYGKPDNTVVYNPVLGLSSDRRIVYVQVTQQMTMAYGKAEAIIEITTSGGKIAGTATMIIDIDRNPMQEGAMKSTSEMKTLSSYVSDAEAAKNAAAASATSAASSASTATTKANAASTSATNAASSASTATTKANAASTSATNAASSASTATTKANAASTSATNAKASENAAKDWSDLSKSYAVGTGGEVRDNDDIDSAKGYYEQLKRVAQGIGGTIPMGTISFSDLAKSVNQVTGYMFNISNSFTSDTRFKDGGGIYYGAGNNVIYTADSKWDVLAASAVTGLKGANESSYRQGNVNLSADDVGAFPGTITIPKGVDLNDYTTPGVYNGVYNGGYLNMPEISTFTLIVLNSGGVYTRQIFVSVAIGNTCYTRVKTTGNFSAWVLMAFQVKGARETEYRGGNVNLTPANIGAVPYYNFTIAGTTDWSSIVEPGSYKVQNASMDADYHAPEGLYRYGTLLVFWAENSGTSEERKIQIYIPNVGPDSTTESYIKGVMAIRSYNNNSWHDWNIFKNSEQNDAAYVPKTAKVKLTGAVFGETTLGSGENSINARMRSIMLGNETESPLWFKIASVSASVKNVDKTISFKVNRTYSLYSKDTFGILTARYRSNSNGAVGNSSIVWENAGTEIIPENFILCYNPSNVPHVVEIWVKIDVRYVWYNFTVLSEGDRTNSMPSWTLYGNPVGVEAPTDGYTQVASTLATLQNPVTKVFSYDQAVTHRNQFRGKNLGTAYTAAQKAAIANGSFDDLYVGDYWVLGGHNWRIVDINYWLNTGDTACTQPHLVIMPDAVLYNAKMNDTDTTAGGYVGSKMYTENLEEAKTTINNLFGTANILNHREYLTNAVMDGYPSSGSWYDSMVELPNEIMMYGSFIYTSSQKASPIPINYTIDKTQLALMQNYPRFLNPVRQTQWLRDISSNKSFTNVSGWGGANTASATTNAGVRPVFGLA